MAVVVWLRILGGDLVETTKDSLSDVNADMPAEYRPGSVLDKAGHIDWHAAGSRAGALAGKGIKGLGNLMKGAGPAMVIMLVADWFLDGALAMLNSEAGKPAATALARLGDVMLDVLAKVLRPMIPLWLRAIKAIYPVLFHVLDIIGAIGIGAANALIPALELGADVLEALATLATRLGRVLTAIGIVIGRVWTTIQTAMQGVAAIIDGAIAGLIGGFAGLLRVVLDSILAPLREHLESLSSLWDEWIGRHLPDVLGESGLRHPLGYMWNDVWYAWGTGPLGEAPHEQRIVEHAPADTQLIAAIATYARANGGLARALWTPG